MGDILHALPAVTALRLAHPNWVIDWVVEPRWRALLAAPESIERGPAQPVVDRLHFAPTKRWRRSPFSLRTIREIAQLRGQLRAAGYSAVIDLQGALRSSVVGSLAGCHRFIGEAEPREGPARWLFTECVATCGAHVIEQDLELARAIAGDTLSPAAPWLPVDPVAEAWCDALLNSAPPLQTSPQPVALMNPGAGWGAKRWPPERYALVARGLVDRGYRVLVNAGPGEEPLADAIAHGTGAAAVRLNASLDQLIALTRRIAVCVAGDTGPLHLACALGRPVVGIYGPTDPSRNGPFGTRFKVLRSPQSRLDHTRHAAPEAGLLTIKPEDVLAATDELLAQETAP